jgi:hypothetical protein
MQFDIQELLQNKTVLYVVLGLALANVVGYMSTGNNDAVMIFFILGVLTSYFSKNMIVIMAVPLLLVSLYVVMRRGEREGLENQSKSTKKPAADQQKGDGVDKLAEKLNVAMATEEKNVIDAEKTMEASLRSLEDKLSSDGMKNLSKETEKLQEQQERLMALMEKLVPMIQNGQNLMQSFEKAGGAGVTDKVGGLIDMFQGLASKFIKTDELEISELQQASKALAREQERAAPSKNN